MTYYTARLKTVTFQVREPEAEPAQTLPNAPAVEPLLRAIFSTLDPDREHFVILAMDAKHRPRGFKVSHTGGSNHSTVDARCVMRDLIGLGAVAFIAAHNHPSGDPRPSIEDRVTTERLAAAGALLALPMLDHIIIGAPSAAVYLEIAERRGFYSFSEARAMPTFEARQGTNRPLFDLAANAPDGAA